MNKVVYVSVGDMVWYAWRVDIINTGVGWCAAVQECGPVMVRLLLIRSQYLTLLSSHPRLRPNPR